MSQNTLDAKGLAAATAAVTAEIDRYWKDDSVLAGHEPVAEAAIRAYIASQEAAAPSEEPVAACPGADDPEERCPKQPHECTCWEVDLDYHPRHVREALATETLADAEARVMQDYRWGNLTKLGVANHLRRAGFNIDAAIDLANAIASPAVAPVASVMTKPLEWRANLLMNWVAPSIVGQYFVFKDAGDSTWAMAVPDAVAAGEFKTADLAKAAAQSDFNARILSSIIPATKGGEVVVEALRNLLADCEEYSRINNLHNEDGSPATNHAMRRARAALDGLILAPEEKRGNFIAVTTDEPQINNWHTAIYEDDYKGLLIAMCNQNGRYPWQVRAILAGLNAKNEALAALSAQDTDGVAKPEIPSENPTNR